MVPKQDRARQETLTRLFHEQHGHLNGHGFFVPTARASRKNKNKNNPLPVPGNTVPTLYRGVSNF
jgi:hypothetical protein